MENGYTPSFNNWKKNVCSASRRLKTVRLCSVAWLCNRVFSLQSFTIRRCLTSHIVTTQPLLFGSWLFFKRCRTQGGGGGLVLWFRAIEAYGFILGARQNFLFTNFTRVFFLKGSRCRTPPPSPSLDQPHTGGSEKCGQGGSRPFVWVRYYCDIFGGSSKSYCDSELLVPRG